MHDRAYALATGVFLVLAIVALIVTGYWLVGADPERRPYIVVAETSVAGLGVGSLVLYRGVPAGRVEGIRINPANPEQVFVRIAVGPEIPVHHSTYARLRQRGFTGVAELELDDTGRHPQPLLTVADEPARIPLRPSLLDEATDAGFAIVENLNELSERLADLIDDENRERLRSVLARLDGTLAAAEALAQALESDLPRTLDSASRSMDAVGAFAERATMSMDQVDELVVELREAAALARRLGDEIGGRAVPGVDRAIEAVDRAAREMARLAQSLAQQPEGLLRGRGRQAPGPGEE
jgi:phospholipid/cholesterol/gamma-HCH transport system substrate-binding protein